MVYFNYIMQARIFMIGLTVLKMSKVGEFYVDWGLNFWDNFHENLLLNREIVELNTFNIYDQL